MKLKALFYTILASFLVIVISGCGPATPDYEQYADQLHEFQPYFTTSEHDFDFREAVGTWPNDKDELGELLINEDFFNTYIEKYGMLDLLERYNAHIMCADDPELGILDKGIVIELNSRNETIKNCLTSLEAYKELETIAFDGKTIESLHGAAGYYGNQKDKKETEEVEGEFNDPNKDNEIYKSSRSQTVETKYYGDWMIKHNYGSRYNKGKYGWNNGVFEDELASWEDYSDFEIYYKGTEFTRLNAESIEDVSFEYKLIDGKMFCWRYDDTYKADQIEWTDAPNENSVTIPNGKEFIDGFEQYLNDNMNDGKYEIKANEDRFSIFRDDTSICNITIYESDDVIDPGSDRLSLKPSAIMISSGGEWDEGKAKLAGALLAFADENFDSVDEGASWAENMVNQKDDYEVLESGNTISINRFNLNGNISYTVSYDYK